MKWHFSMICMTWLEKSFCLWREAFNSVGVPHRNWVVQKGTSPPPLLWCARVLILFTLSWVLLAFCDEVGPKYKKTVCLMLGLKISPMPINHTHSTNRHTYLNILYIHAHSPRYTYTYTHIHTHTHTPYSSVVLCWGLRTSILVLASFNEGQLPLQGPPVPRLELLTFDNASIYPSSYCNTV